jgi:hypothetical protein
VNGPPVEIMPLPSDSFMSDDGAAELLNNPYTLDLDKDKYGAVVMPAEKTSEETSHRLAGMIQDQH